MIEAPEKSLLRLKRIPYEEPDSLQIDVKVTNGSFAGSLDFYCNAVDLIAFGRRLIKFPVSLKDEQKWEIGTSVPEDRHYCHVCFRAFVFDSRGSCGLRVILSTNDISPDDAKCEFSIIAGAASINRLGGAMIQLGSLTCKQFIWTPEEVEIIK